MKTKDLLLLGGLGVAAWYYLGVAKAAALAQIVFSGITINSLTDWTATFIVQNVTNSTIVLNSMAGNLLVNGNQLANISSFTRVEIPGNSQQAIQIDVKPSLLNIPGDIMQMLQAGSTALSFEAKGAANVNNIPIPFDTADSIAV